MTDSDSTLLVIAAATPTIVSFAKWATERWVNRADKREEQAEDSAAEKLDDVLKAVTELKTAFALTSQTLLQQQAAVEALRQRVDGISGAHAPKLDDLSKRLTRVETQLEERMPRHT